MAARRFPPPRSVDGPETKLGQNCFIVRDANGHGRSVRSSVVHGSSLSLAG
jgi:hypothetical protein